MRDRRPAARHWLFVCIAATLPLLLSLAAAPTIRGQASFVVNAGGPYVGQPGIPITFTAQTNVGALGIGVQPIFRWTFGDGTTAVGQIVQHTYVAAGSYPVTVTVLLPTGQPITSATTTAIVGQASTGLVNAGGPYLGVVGQPITMFGTVSAAFGGGLVQYQWNFGDGTTATGQIVTHAYTAAGTYQVTLTVLSSTGVTGSATTIATISGQSQLIVNADGPYSGTVDQPITFSGIATGPVAGAPLTFLWNFGDGTSGTGQVVTHAYTAAGTYSVTLTVTTPTGQTGAAVTMATVGAGTGTTPAGTTETVTLIRGCNNVVLTWPSGSAITTIASAVSPSASLRGIWRYDAAAARFFGFSPQAPATANDLTIVNRLDAVFICVNAAATLTRPSR